MRFFIINLLFCQLYAITGYLYENEVTVCQDACSQYAIHHEVLDIAPTNVIFNNSITNIDLYINRFVEVDLGEEVTCVECSAFEIQNISLSDDCEYNVDCFQDPCITYECYDNPNLECLPNFCGGCFADFYDLNDNLVDCTSASESCSEMDEIGCNNNNSCDWIDSTETGSCSSLSLSVCDYPEYGSCYSDCTNWGNYYNGMFCYGTMYCTGGSYLLDNSYCEEIEYFTGDINQDNIINIQDVIIIINLILSAEFDSLADINNDGIVNVLDIIEIVNIILSN